MYVRLYNCCNYSCFHRSSSIRCIRQREWAVRCQDRQGYRELLHPQRRVKKRFLVQHGQHGADQYIGSDADCLPEQSRCFRYADLNRFGYRMLSMHRVSHPSVYPLWNPAQPEKHKKQRRFGSFPKNRIHDSVRRRRILDRHSGPPSLTFAKPSI